MGGQPLEYIGAPKMLARLEQLLSTIIKDLGLEKRKADCMVAMAVAKAWPLLMAVKWATTADLQARMQEAKLQEEFHLEREFWLT